MDNVDFAEALRRIMTSHTSDLFTAMIGEVVSYDASKMLATIRPVTRRPVPQKDLPEAVVFEALPDLPEVPICFPRGGGCSMTFPLSKGDGVLLVFMCLDPGPWRSSGGVRDAADLRPHHPAHAFAIPCVAPDTKKLNHATQNAMVLEGPSILVGAGASDYPTLLNKVVAEFAAIAATISSLTGSASFGTAYTPNTDLGATKTKVE